MIRALVLTLALCLPLPALASGFYLPWWAELLFALAALPGWLLGAIVVAAVAVVVALVRRRRRARAMRAQRQAEAP